MTKIIEKIVLGVLIIVLLSFNSYFIYGLNDDRSLETQKSSNANTLQQISLAEEDIEDDDDDNEIEDEEENEADDEDEEDDEEVVDQQEIGNARITEQRAREIAIDEVGGRVIEVEIERENGRLIYEVEVKDGNDEYEVEIDAETGEVLEVEREDDEDDD